MEPPLSPSRLEAPTDRSVPARGLTVEHACFVLKSGHRVISDVSFSVPPGRLCALMGPSGAGKTTLLDMVAQRVKGGESQITWNGALNWSPIRDASYSEQTDDLIGVLTVRESLRFAARLSHGYTLPRSDADNIAERTLRDLGLSAVADHRIGTPIQRGISGGQKRRVTLGTSLVSGRKLLLLDEPTSGLDSTSSREVISCLRALARSDEVAVLAVIHQPSFETLCLFDDVLFLAQGQTVFQGPVTQLSAYLAELGYPVEDHFNPADAMLDICSTDFGAPEKVGLRVNEADIELDQLVARWKASHVSDETFETSSPVRIAPKCGCGTVATIRNLFHASVVLMHRNVLNYSRNILAYGIRAAMFLGMGVLMALVWMNLPQTNDHVQDRLSVSFYSVAFLSFMSVAGIPAFLEERGVFVRERRNGLYSPLAYAIANLLTGLPFIFFCALLFLVVAYWSIGLHPGASAFFRYLAYTYLALIAAETQSLLVAALLPIFVAALAVVAFLNGFWMSLGGYFIRTNNIPRWLYHWATQIDYQRYSFDLLVSSDISGLTFTCAEVANGTCFCSYATPLNGAPCIETGDQILDAVGIGYVPTGQYIGILFSIIAVYRILFWLALDWRSR